MNTVGDLLHFSEQKLQEHYGINTGLLSTSILMILAILRFFLILMTMFGEILEVF